MISLKQKTKHHTHVIVLSKLEMNVQVNKRAAGDLEPRLNNILPVIKHELSKEQLDIVEFRRL